MQIIKYPDKRLFIPCTEVTVFDESLHKQLDLLTESMLKYKGVGLSANQLGFEGRFFVMLELNSKEVKEFINSEIIDVSNVLLNAQEGCLSLPGEFVPIQRPSEVTVKAYNRFGEEFIVVLQDMEARCALHEIGHLDGEDFLLLTNRQNRRRVLKTL